MRPCQRVGFIDRTPDALTLMVPIFRRTRQVVVLHRRLKLLAKYLNRRASRIRNCRPMSFGGGVTNFIGYLDWLGILWLAADDVRTIGRIPVSQWLLKTGSRRKAIPISGQTPTTGR